MSKPDPGELKLVLPGRRVPAGQGMAWIVTGWRLFKKAPLMWVLSLLVLVVLFCVSLVFGPLGIFAASILKVVFFAGFMVGCRELERNGSFDLEHLFAGFTRKVGTLLILSISLFVGLFVILFITVAFWMITIGVHLFVSVANPDDLLTILKGAALYGMLGTLLMLALLTPLAMAYLFAPALIVLNGLGAGAAMKASFMGCLRNVMPFLVYSILMLLLACAAALPIFLGFIVWIPLVVTSTYAAYRAIFTEPDAPAAPVATTL